ncbi:MAG: hypothetical protein U0T69_07555 [Chitinophagales bacterium]
MKKYVLIILSTMAFCSCTKENVTSNNAPSSVSGFSIEYGSSNIYNWSDATDADGDAVTYDVYLLMDVSSKPFKIAQNLTVSEYTSGVSFLGTLRAMIVVAKDGKGGETTSIEYPTIII